MPTSPKKVKPKWITKPLTKRTTDNTFYHTTQWRRVRNYHIKLEPLCRHCKEKGRIVKGEEVDHIIPITEGGERFDHNNLQTLCKSCHSRKTMSEIKKRKRDNS